MTLRGLMSRARLSLSIGLIAVATLVQLAALPLPGSSDMRIFRIWTYGAATAGPTQVYGTGGSLPTWRQLTQDRIWPAEEGDSSRRRWLTFDGDVARVDYPPVALYALALVGWLYRAVFPTFPAGIALTIAIKLLAVLAGVGLTVLIMSAVTTIEGRDAGRWAGFAFWTNPAVILHGAVLGYLDAVSALPAVAALIAASRQRASTAGALLAISCLIKPQGLLVLPALAVALSPRQPGGWRASGLATLAGAITVSVCLVPIAAAGAFGNMCTALAHLLTDGQLAGNALNAWWLVTFVGQTARDLAQGTLATALAHPVESVSIPDFFARAGVDASVGMFAALGLGAWTAVVAVVAWATWQARDAADLPRLSALAAFTVHAYSVLALQVHENHLFLALPLLAIVAATEPQYRTLFLAVTGIAALNLNLLYGFGEGVGYAIPRTLTGIDPTVIVAALNCAALAWHAAIFRRLAGQEAGSAFFRRGRRAAGRAAPADA